MAEKIRNFVASRKFFWLIVAIFVLQGVWFAGSLKYNMPPDESYHYNFIRLYTQQPLSHGPFISHQPDSYLYHGDIQQTPSFLYHYTMSFPLRIFNGTMSDMNHRVVALRVINVVIGALCLLVLGRLFRRVRAGAFVSNVALALFASTGMFLWISAAVSYDTMSMLGWFLFLLCLLRLQVKLSLYNAMLVLLFAIFTVITKVTYAPVILALLIVYGAMNRQRLGEFTSAVINRPLAKKTLGGSKAAMIVLSAVFVVICGLALGRVGYNLARYHSVSPSCQAVHGASACSVSTPIQRDNQVRVAFERFKRNGGHIDFNPVSFTGDWLDKMYQRAYFYLGHKKIIPDAGPEIALAMAASFVAYLFMTKRSRLVETDQEALLVAALWLYVAALFLLNYHSYLTTGTNNGYQGRYLLPVIPIAYIFVLKLVRQTYRRLPAAKRPLLTAACVVLLLAFLYQDFPGLVFLKGTDANWYSQPTASVNLKLKHAMMKSHLFHPSVLEN